MKRPVIAVLSVALMLFAGATAQAGVTWQTTPVLGIGSSYDGDVHINNTGSLPWANIPHDVDTTDPAHNPDSGGPQPIGMTVFTVGQEVHSGSGVYVDNGVTYGYSALFTHLTDSSRSKSYSGSFVGSGSFWMTWNTPDGGGDGGGVPTLTAADIGQWQYTETYTGSGTLATYTTDFSVVPEPATLVIWSLLSASGLGLARWRRRK